MIRASTILGITLAFLLRPMPQSSLVMAQSSPKTDDHPATQPDSTGDEACQSCHRDKTEAFHQTAHYLTSRDAGPGSILGTFSPGGNVLKTANPYLFFRMEEKQDSAGKGMAFFQTSVEGQSPRTTERSEQFALVIGSGGKGQTYLYWKEDDLFQLPVSYWRTLGWVNSPGYRDGYANFDRPITPRCLECHATYFKTLPPPPDNRYSKQGYTLGIRCEKCHGLGRAHAEREKSGSAPPPQPDTLNPARFSRDRQIDLCAWCHAGHGKSLVPAFSYQPGSDLKQFIELPRPDPDAPLDVHGNQVEMLKQSRCFIESQMTCLTCHDVHTSQHDLAGFSNYCLSCHKPDSPAFLKQSHPASGNCIDCHMPLEETNLIIFDSKGSKARPKIRNHWIKIYPQTSPSPAPR